MSKQVDLFTDGACSGNPGPGGWGALFIGPGDEINEIGGFSPQTTSNAMELEALASSLEEFDRNGGLEASKKGILRIRAHLDSEYVLGGVRSWGKGWRSNGWKTKEGKEVANRPLWERILALTDRAGAIEWISVRGHRGHPANERVDEIAVAFSKSRKPALFRGSRGEYPHPAVLRFADHPEAAKLYPKPVYISFVEGSVSRHASWPDCENHVRGKKGARFKKVHSDLEERETLGSWKAGSGRTS